MNKKETAVILEIIATMYQNKFKVGNKQLLLDLWHDALKEYEFESISKNLKAYYKTNVFPPSVADLIEYAEKKEKYVPTVSETVLLLEEQEKKKEKAASDPNVQEAKAKARAEINRILGRV